MKLGLVTYQLAKNWDLATILANCEESGFGGVELRTTHAHGVEVELSTDERNEVQTRFAGSSVELVGLGSAFEYDAVDSDEVRRNIDGTKEYAQLAADVGAPGVKVRPNRVHDDEGVPRERTFEQIGVSLCECGEFARDLGVEIRLEVHGRVTCEPENVRTILDYADCDNVFACWNSNQQDLDETGSVDNNFQLLSEDLSLVHINELWKPEYPWARLFELLHSSGYQGFALAEIPESPDAVRLMKYYQALFRELGGGLD
ncbi:MAG: TIM barrel protein [Candidatus Latescibacterota bacterium]|nr:TIM barrel protein [Candidatus Latescibacterota bacterium]